MQGETMRVIYRMRGLLGDATEDMVNSLDSGNDEDVDNEEVYKMANIMSECNGLHVMLQRLVFLLLIHLAKNFYCQFAEYFEGSKPA